MSPYDVLAAREVGKLPLSIGTALAIEALEDNKSYGSLWINIRTLYRNIYEAVDKDSKQFLTPRAIADVLQEEVGYILEYSQGKIDKVKLYHREYNDLFQRFPRVIPRVPNTPIQKAYNNMMNRTIDELLLRDKQRVIDFNKGSILVGEPTKALIITHYPVDLLSKTSFTRLRLLESYTGAIKSSSQWGTKLTDGKLYPRIPFNKFTIQIFGDGPVLFMRYPKNVREAVLEVAEQYKWTRVTPMEKIKQNLAWMKDRAAYETLKGFF